VNRGFTLVEVLISLVLMLLLAAVGIRFFLLQHWIGISQTERTAVQTALRAGGLFLSAELRELGGMPGDPDILAFGADSVRYRAMRGTGVSCARSATAILVDASGFSGYRTIQAGRDSLLLHFEGTLHSTADDRWIHLPIHAIGSATCAVTPAIQLATTLDTVQFPLRGFAPLAPFRTFEVMQVNLYQSNADYWLGARSISAGETIQPLTGPMTANGLELVYLDSLGSPPTRAEDIRTIAITLRAVSSLPIRPGGGSGSPSLRTDSLRTFVALRNW
jgi:prepilin-type N-terminal cleavage/methylation domain-containing protein